MTGSFENKKVLVTGGTRGIGAAIAAELSKNGALVTITGTKASSQKNYIRADFTDLTSTKTFLDQVKNDQFDIVINNAGINKINSITDISLDDWNKILLVNLTVPFQIIQAALPYMVSKGFGRIVNISSIFGEVSKEKRAAYSASKFGLLGLTKACAAEYAKNNILVNCLAPGFIDTELTRSVLNDEQIKQMVSQVPMNRLGNPTEISKAVSFLASPENTFITGQLMLADGGFTSV